MSDIVIEIKDESEYKKLLDKKIENRMTWKEILMKGVENI
jgi:hypothetical protein